MTSLQPAPTEHWLPAETFLAMGFRPAGPEIDYGMRWGGEQNIRVSYAPYRNGDGGFLYAHDPARDRYLLLHADTTHAQVETAWHQLVNRDTGSEAYRAFTELIEHGPLPTRQAHELLRHCIDREMAARRDYATCDTTAYRVDAAHAVVIARSARRSAETLLIDAVHAEIGAADPVVVGYQVAGNPGWTGRLPSRDVETAAAEAKVLARLANDHGYLLSVTSVIKGPTTIPAREIPNFDAARGTALNPAPIVAV